MDPLFLGAVVVAALAAAGTGIANWRLGRRTDREVERRRHEAAIDSARRAGLELIGERQWRCVRGSRTVDVEFKPLAETSHMTVHQGYAAQVRVTPMEASKRATFRVTSGFTVLQKDILIGDARLDRVLAIVGSDARDVQPLLGDDDVKALLKAQLYEVASQHGPVTLTRFGALVLDDDGLRIEAAPWPDNADGREPPLTTRAVAVVDFALAFADAIDAAHARAPRPLGDAPDLGSTSGGSSSAGVRVL